MPIPPCDPGAEYREFKTEIDSAVNHVLTGGQYILGEEVTAFEREYAAYIGTRFAVGCGSGTDALHLCLRACGVGPGDEVVTVAHTAVATVAAIELAGAVPVLVDIDPATFTLSPRRFAAAVSKRTRAVVPVHLYGHPAAMDRILNIAREHGLWVIEDCAQSHGARFQQHITGTIGHLGAFSFYPTKNLSGMGDGGAVVTNDPDLADRLVRLREYGWHNRYISEVPGLNSRLDELQAAVLRVKLRHLDHLNHLRRQRAEQYRALLDGLEVKLPIERKNVTHVYHQFVVRSGNRDALRRHLEKQGIYSLVHYPVPVDQQPAYRGRISVHNALPETLRAAEEVLSLPLYPGMTANAVERVVESICQWERKP